MSAKTLTFSRKLLKTFIQLYKESPCLWNRKCVAYKHKQKRNEAISRLTELVREHDPSATKVHVLRKIESIRACVRREYKKVQASLVRAQSEEDVYVPILWYYNLLSFVCTEELRDSKTKIEFVVEEDDNQSDNPDMSEEAFESPTHTYSDFAITSNMKEELPDTRMQKQHDEDGKWKQHCTEVDDEYDAIGINVAAKLRGLPSNVRILAEKLINDVLFQAQTNTLSTLTVITTADPFK